MNICVYGASSKTIDISFTDAGEALGYEMAKRGHTLVFGGGASGLMGAVARGITKGKGYIIGVAPRYFDVDGILYEHCNEVHVTDTMRERKQKMEDFSSAFIMTPGGTGTFDEFFEILTLKQVGRHTLPIAILNTNGYFDHLVELIEVAIAGNFMTEANRQLYKVCDTPEEVLDYIEGYTAEGNKKISDYKDI